METKFTPGPWVAIGTQVVRPELNGAIEIAQVPQDSREDLANAELIAKAPAMVAMVKRLLDHLDGIEGYSPSCAAARKLLAEVGA